MIFIKKIVLELFYRFRWHHSYVPMRSISRTWRDNLLGSSARLPGCPFGCMHFVFLIQFTFTFALEHITLCSQSHTDKRNVLRMWVRHNYYCFAFQMWYKMKWRRRHLTSYPVHTHYFYFMFANVFSSAYFFSLFFLLFYTHFFRDHLCCHFPFVLFRWLSSCFGCGLRVEVAPRNHYSHK